MTRAYAVPSAFATSVGGAAAGVMGGLAAMAALLIGASLTNHQPVAGLNAVGAFTVPWLNTAAPDALDQFYWDASLGGAAYILVACVLGGALFALILARLPEDHPIAWGAILGVSAFVVLRWAIAPALDPLLIRTFDWPVLLATCVVYGIVVGYWVHLSRDVAARLTRNVQGA